jgi:hypothetical protein
MCWWCDGGSLSAGNRQAKISISAAECASSNSLILAKETFWIARIDFEARGYAWIFPCHHRGSFDFRHASVKIIPRRATLFFA